MMTNWAARYVMKENVLGSLEKGKWADFVVLSKDYFEGPPDALYDVYPEMTVIAGNIKVLREDFARELGKQAVGPQVRWTDEEPPPPPPE